MNIRQWGHHAMGFCMWHGAFLFNTILGKGRHFNHEEKGAGVNNTTGIGRYCGDSWRDNVLLIMLIRINLEVEV